MKLLPHHPHSHFLLHVEKPAKYAGSEFGRIAAPEDPALRLALAFPDLYDLGCSNLGLTILQRIASSRPGVHVERAFAPWNDYAAKLQEHGETLVSYESAIPLGSFDVLGFSLQHELLYTNVLSMLRLAGITLRAEERLPDEPIVIAGGPSVSNPEPLAHFIDAFAFGDGEVLLPAILEAVAEAKSGGKPRIETLEALAGIEGLYVPRFYERSPAGDRAGRHVVTGPKPGAAACLPVSYGVYREFETSPVYDHVVAAIEPVFDRYQIEITRGCAAGCRFCHAGSIYRPVRHRPPGRVLKSAVQGVLATGSSAISLGSLSPADYPYLEQLVPALEDFISRHRIQLSVSSLRSFGVSEKVLKSIAAVKATGITLAPEAGTQRMRDAIGKQVTHQDLLQSIELLAGLEWKRVKLYFMIGLPGEKEEDYEGIVDTLAQCRKIAARTGKRRMEITAAISNFVPKPFTPFQREKMARLDDLMEAADSIRRRAMGLNVKIDFHDMRQSTLESVLARGGSELGPVLEEAVGLGCGMDSWTDRFDPDLWGEAFRRCGVDMQRYLEAIPDDEPLPWSHVSAPVSEKFLRREMKRSTAGRTTPICSSPDKSPVCHACGAACREDGEPRPPGPDMAAAALWLERTMEGLGRQRAKLFAGPLDEGVRLHLGLTFRRRGRMIYTGHQDMIRIMTHILRRANLPLRYSSGFTPRPLMNFRCALPLGVVGLNEQVFVEITHKPVGLEPVLELLGSRTHPGIDFTAARAAGRKEVRELIARLPAIQWLVGLPASTPDRSLEEAVEKISGAASIMTERKRKRKKKRHGGSFTQPIDLKEMIEGIEIAGPSSLSDIAALDDTVGRAKAVVFNTIPAAGHLIRRDEIDFILAPHGLRPSWHIRKLVHNTV
ncbi:MAG: TIGR03960 family B12-binding radical SAM protein [Pseudomonadota bacterium]